MEFLDVQEGVVGRILVAACHHGGVGVGVGVGAEGDRGFPLVEARTSLMGPAAFALQSIA